MGRWCFCVVMVARSVVVVRRRMVVRVVGVEVKPEDCISFFLLFFFLFFTK